MPEPFAVIGGDHPDQVPGDVASDAKLAGGIVVGERSQRRQLDLTVSMLNVASRLDAAAERGR